MGICWLDYYRFEYVVAPIPLNAVIRGLKALHCFLLRPVRVIDHVFRDAHGWEECDELRRELARYKHENEYAQATIVELQRDKAEMGKEVQDLVRALYYATAPAEKRGDGNEH